MLLDIIIPVYNVNSYIRDCIDSVIDLPRTNIIIVNDGSVEDADFLKEIYSKYQNFYYYKKENGGLSSARNFGIEKSTSEYIMFLDGDDFVDTAELKSLIEKISSEKEDSYMFFYDCYFEEDGRVEPEEISSYFLSSDYASVEDAGFRKNPPVMVAWRYIVKREIILQNKLYFTKGIYHEDEEWSSKLWCTVPKVRIYQKYIYNYRQRKGSISSGYGYKHIMDLLKIIENLDEFEREIKDLNRVDFIKRKKLELFKEVCKRAVDIKFSKSERRNFNNQYREILNKVDLKYGVMKYLPFYLIKFLLKLKYCLKGIN